MAEKFKEILTRHDGPSEYDTLDGEDLCDGEVIEVGWPDQSISCELVRVDVRTTEGGARNDIYFTTTSHAYVDGKYRGAKARVRLAGMLGCRGRDLRARRG